MIIPFRKGGKTVKKLYKLMSLVVVSVLAMVLCSSCASGNVRELEAEKTQPQLVPQEQPKDSQLKKAEEAPKAPAVKKEEVKKDLPAPEVKKPEAKKPEAKKPEAKKPEVKKPEVKKPEAKKVAVKLPCTHTVRSGENLWRISVSYYGKGIYWKQIYNANKKQIRKAEYLEPGTVLTIPAVKKAK